MLSSRFRILLLALISTASIYFGFLATNPEKQELLFRNYGYWNILILLTSFISLLCIGNGKALLKWIQNRESIALISSCFIAAAFLYTREGGGFKITFDEHLLSSVAQSMSSVHEPIIRESSLVNTAWFQVIDKRPLLFPLILSLVHNIFGYNVANAFYLNFVLTALFLGLLYSILKLIANRTAARYGIAIACFMPLIEQNSSGGGFEMLNLCGILISTLLTIEYWKSPSATRLSKLVLSLALLSHIRYESVLLALPFAILVGLSWIRDKRIILPLPVILVPLSYIPLAWQFNFVKTQPEYWQYSLDGDRSFDLSYFFTNIRHAFNFLFIPNNLHAGSPIIGILGVSSLITLITFSLTRRKAFYSGRPARIVAIVAGIGLLLQTLLVMCFTFGQLDNPMVSRLGLPLILLLIASGAIMLGIFHQTNKYGRAVSLVITIGAALFAFKSYASPGYTNSNILLKSIDATISFAKSQPPGNYLFISTISRPLELEKYNNISVNTARLRLPNIKRHMELKTYDRVFVVQFGNYIDNGNGIEKQILKKTELGPKVELAPLLERSLYPMSFIRISEISGFDLDRTDEEDDSKPEQIEANQGLSEEEYKNWVDSLP